MAKDVLPAASASSGAGEAEITELRRAVMRANAGKNTKPEIMVRRILHAMGYRFRVHRRDLPGTPDITFPSRRKVIQVHGCFWHQHPGCRKASPPATRVEFWASKFTKNKERDRRTLMQLIALGWSVMVVWECELKDAADLRRRMSDFLGPPGSGTTR